MIPSLTQAGILPPFLENEHGPALPAAMAPYKTNLEEIIERFSTSEDRITILKGLLNYRKELKRFGMINGFQWIDGSFVEDCETIRELPPKDIDVVTFSYRPMNLLAEDVWREFGEINRTTLFNNEYCKKTYKVDAFYADLHTSPHFVAQQARYWFGLFSHQRATYLWKGCLQVDLSEDENTLLARLEELQNA